MGPKWDLLSLLKNLIFFSWNYSSIKTLNRLNWFFGGWEFCIVVFGQKGAQMSFLSFITNLCIEFFGLFAWSYSNIKVDSFFRVFRVKWPKMGLE